MPTHHRPFFRSTAFALLTCALAISASAAQGDATKDAASSAPAAMPAPGPELTPIKAAELTPALWVSDAFGVEVQGARLSASGYVIDLRYRVLDAEKSRPLLDRKVRPVLVDETTGNRFYVPQPPVVGNLRQTSRNNAVAVGKTYFMIFANPDQRLKAGSTVALYLGDQRFGNLRIDP
jgi:hypothetical protein